MLAKVGADAPVSGTIPPAVCLVAAGVPGSPSKGAWLVDSGASVHMCGQRDMFVTLAPLKVPVSVTFGDGGVGHATETGAVLLRGPHAVVKLVDVLLVPSLAGNLLSISAATSHGVHAHFDPSAGTATFSEPDGTTVLTATLADGLYWVDLAQQHSASRATIDTLDLQRAQDWHELLGHTRYKHAVQACSLTCSALELCHRARLSQLHSSRRVIKRRADRASLAS